MSIEGVNDYMTTESDIHADDMRDNGREDIDSLSDETSHDHDGDKRKRRKQSAVGEVVFCRPLEVNVRDDRVDQAIRQLKNRMAREGVLRELKNRRHYFKPSELKRIKRREAARRRRKQVRQKVSR